jgi:ribosomal protein S18 acetylase RimI-like enzyme
MMREREGARDSAVRRAAPADGPFIVALGAQVFAPYDAKPGRTVAALLEREAAIALVAHDREDGGERRGFAIVHVRPLGRSFGPWRDPATAALEAIAVRPDVHGRGVGSLLLREAEEAAHAAGAVGMTLTTAQTNAPARRLFAAHRYATVMEVVTYMPRQVGLVMWKAL